LDRKTILSPTRCDPRTLPLGAVEAFFLSQVDGHLTLEEIAEIVGLELGTAITLAKQLVLHGAVRDPQAMRAPTRREIPALRQRSLRPPRVDPRAEVESIRPPRRESRARVSLRPPRTEPPPERRATRRSIKMAPVSGAQTPPPPTDEPCELDDATLAAIRAFEARLDATHHAVLGIERGAGRKAVKSAYYALAAKWHPDRFFKKKLGKVRASIEKIFRRITEAHDVLTDATRRDAYERTLPADASPPSQVPVTKPSMRPSKAPPVSVRPPRASKAPPASVRARASKAPPASVRASKAPPASERARASKAPPASVRASKAPPASVRASKAPPASVRARPSKAPPASVRARPSKAPPASATPKIAPVVDAPVTQRSAPRVAVAPPPVSLRQPPVAAPAAPPPRMLSSDAKRRVELFIQAGDEALRANDAIGAANNYRIALQNSNDPALRAKLEMVEGIAKERRFELSLPRARTAEREQRWAEAAHEYARAHAARPSAELAERAAHALRMSDGDMTRAVELAEWAVARAPKSAEFRLTLADVCLAARKLERAAAECEAARSLAPNDARVGTLYSAITKAIRAVRGT
jgi:hypothetical protein